MGLYLRRFTHARPGAERVMSFALLQGATIWYAVARLSLPEGPDALVSYADSEAYKRYARDVRGGAGVFYAGTPRRASRGS